jgi:hypothetical protein
VSRGAVHISSSITAAGINFVTFLRCRVFGSAAGGACYLEPSAITIWRVCSNNCWSESHGHFPHFADGPGVDYSPRMSSATVLLAGGTRPGSMTSGSVSFDAHANLNFDTLNFIHCTVG